MMCFSKPFSCLCYLFNPCEMPSKHPMVGAYVAIAPSWWGTKHSSHVSKTNDADGINSSVDPVHQWLQCAVFLKEVQKNIRKLWYLWSYQRRVLHFLYQASLPSSKHQQVPETFWYHGPSPSYKGYLKLAGLFCSTKKCPNQAQP